MAEKQQKKNTWLYIVLAVAVAVFIFDSLTSDQSLVKVTASRSKQTKAQDGQTVKVTEDVIISEQQKIFSYRKKFLQASFKKNPFFKPITRQEVARPKPKPGLVVMITQIIEGNPPYAEIDGQFLTIGDLVEGWRIVEIKDGKVTFEKNGERTILSKNSGLKMMEP